MESYLISAKGFLTVLKEKSSFILGWDLIDYRTVLTEEFPMFGIVTYKDTDPVLNSATKKTLLLRP